MADAPGRRADNAPSSRPDGPGHKPEGGPATTTDPVVRGSILHKLGLSWAEAAERVNYHGGSEGLRKASRRLEDRQAMRRSTQGPTDGGIVGHPQPDGPTATGSDSIGSHVTAPDPAVGLPEPPSPPATSAPDPTRAELDSLSSRMRVAEEARASAEARAIELAARFSSAESFAAGTASRLDESRRALADLGARLAGLEGANLGLREIAVRVGKLETHSTSDALAAKRLARVDEWVPAVDEAIQRMDSILRGEIAGVRGELRDWINYFVKVRQETEARQNEVEQLLSKATRTIESLRQPGDQGGRP
jgi:hypothetical protein